GEAIAYDALGNIYVTGSFSGTADFNPGSGVAFLNCAGASDIFILKLAASANFEWAIGLGDTSGDLGRAITVDNSGSIYTAGFFEGTVDFDPESTTLDLVSPGVWTAFVQKLNQTISGVSENNE